MSDPVIMARLSAIEARLAAIESGGAPRASGGGSSSGGGAVADASDLDGKYGDVRVKFGLKPKYWAEQPDPFIGKKWSQCSAEYLDACAKYFDAYAYAMRKNASGPDDEKKASYKDRDAARCRGWAARIRSGYVPPAEAPSTFAGDSGPSSGGGFGSSSSGFGADTGGSDDSFNYGTNAGSSTDEGDIPFITDATRFGRRDRP